MGSDLLVDELRLFVLLWLCIILSSYLWCHDRPTGFSTTPIPTPKRSPGPKPFPSLIHKPHCDVCKQAAQALSIPRAPASPPRMISTRGRRRVVDTSSHRSPQPSCAYQGQVGFGNISANGHPSGRAWRQLPCTACGSYFLETHDTLFHGKRVLSERIVYIIACLAEGLGIRGTARVFEVDPHTVCNWLVEAADQVCLRSCQEGEEVVNRSRDDVTSSNTRTV
jgi:hypothetical protein